MTSWFSWQNQSSVSYWAEKFSSFEACSKCKNQNKKLVIWLLVVTQFLKRHMSFFQPRYLLGPNSSLSPPKKRFKNSSLFRSHISLIDLDLGAKLLHLVWKECTYIFPKISNVAFLEKMWKVKEKIFLYSSGVLMPIQKYIFTNVFHFVVKYLTYLLTYWRLLRRKSILKSSDGLFEH